MKKILMLILITFTFASCGIFNKKPQLTIYNWSYYIPEEVIKNFEEEYNVKINYETFFSNEEMYFNTKQDLKKYDIVFPSGDYVSVMKKNNLLEKINKRKIRNFQNIDQVLIDKIEFDIGNVYSVPYMIGASGIAVNKKYVKNYKRNFDIYINKAYFGKTSLLKDMREVIGNALATLGYSVNSRDPKEIKEAGDLIKEWEKNGAQFNAKTFAEEFTKENYWIVQAYAENIFLESAKEFEKNVEFFIPETGGTMYIDNMVILKKSKNKKLAYKFINYIHEPKVYAKIADFLMLPSLNQEARPFMKEKPHYTIEDLKRCEFIVDLGEDIKLYENIWKEIKKSNEE